MQAIMSHLKSPVAREGKVHVLQVQHASVQKRNKRSARSKTHAATRYFIIHKGRKAVLAPGTISSPSLRKNSTYIL